MVAQAIVNPDGLKVKDDGDYPDSVAERVPYMLRVLVASWAFITSIGIMMTFPAPHIIDYFEVDPK